MDRKYIEKHNVIERYVLNKLTPTERDEFEQFFLDDPQMLDEVESAKRFLEGLKSAAKRDTD